MRERKLLGELPVGLSNCSSVCVNEQTDVNNCGGCAKPCPAGDVCQSGSCVLSCQAGLSNCSGVCVNEQTDVNNCGGCAKPCPSGDVCVSGACALSCQSGLSNCGGTCTNTSYDPANCGGCGKACPASNACVTGVCVPAFTTGCGRFPKGFSGAWATVAANPFSPGMGLIDYLPASTSTATMYLMSGVSFDQYQTATNTYTALASNATGLTSYGSSAYYNGSIWSMTNGAVVAFNIATSAWTTPKTGLPLMGANQTAVDDSGNLWSYESSTVLIEYNVASGTVTTHTLTAAIPMEPRIAWDSCTGLLYLASYAETVFYSYNPTTGVQTTLASPPGGLDIQDGMCGDRSGHIFTVTNSATMYQYTISTGIWTAMPAGGPQGESNSACGVGADGYLYATDPAFSSTMYRILLN